MPYHELVEGHLRRHAAQYEKDHHKETLETVRKEHKKFDDDYKEAEDQLKSQKKRARESDLAVTAKKAKLEEAKQAVTEAQGLLNEANKEVAESTTKMENLDASRKAKAEEERKIIEKEPTYDAVIAKQEAKNNEMTLKLQDTFGKWSNTYLQTVSGSLFYPTPRAPFGSEDEAGKSGGSQTGSPAPQKNARKGVDAAREAFGMVQRLNNPVYLVNRLENVMEAKFSDAMGVAPVQPLDRDKITGHDLCFMLEADGNQFSGAPAQVFLAVLLKQRLDEKTTQLLVDATTSGAPITLNAATGQAAKEFIHMWKAKAQASTKVGTSDEKLRKKIMASANTGSIFKGVVDYYGYMILIILPLAEFFTYDRRQKTDSLSKGKTRALAELVDNNRHEYLAKFLKVLVSLLKRWVVFSGVNSHLIAGKVNEREQFLKELQEIREQYNLPTSSHAPFSWSVKMKPVDHWELTASTSGWDLARTAELKVVLNGDQQHPTKVNPQRILCDIFGQEYSFVKDNFTVSHATDLSKATMTFLLRLLRPETQSGFVQFFVVDCRDGKKFTYDVKNLFADQTVCALLLDDGWVVTWLLRPKAAIVSWTVVVLAYADQSGGAGTPIADKALQCLELKGHGDLETVKISVPQPQEDSSGIHALCHMLAIRNRYHHWITQLTDDHVMDIRHALLRATTMAFTRAADTENGSASDGDLQEEGA